MTFFYKFFFSIFGQFFLKFCHSSIYFGFFFPLKIWNLFLNITTFFLVKILTFFLNFVCFLKYYDICYSILIFFSTIFDFLLTFWLIFPLILTFFQNILAFFTSKFWLFFFSKIDLLKSIMTFILKNRFFPPKILWFSILKFWLISPRLWHFLKYYGCFFFLSFFSFWIFFIILWFFCHQNFGLFSKYDNFLSQNWDFFTQNLT